MCEGCGCGDKTVSFCAGCGGRMVLINDVPVCTACGARGSAEAHIHAHGEHHHHPHAHSDEPASAKLDDLARLRILLVHWVEHNEEHLHDLRSWATRARAAGQEGMVSSMDRAIEHMEACNQALLEALEASSS